MKKTIEFECKIITPMFAGTALPGECELRPPAIKGALRFWWRALHGHLPIKDLREKEREIFGGVGKAVRRSSFDVAVEHEMVAKMPPQDDLKKKGKLGKWEEVKGKSFSINVLDYLAYGKHIRKFRGEYKPDGKEKKEIKYIQKCFLPDQRFLLKISYSTDNESSMESVWQALDCLVRFGGLGSQTRNGWGQFEILNWPDALKKVNDPFPKSVTDLAAYTAFSKKTTFFETKECFCCWDKALGEVGDFYRDFRIHLEGSNCWKRRVLLGQPIISEEVGDEVEDMFLQRHAKAVFMSVRKKSTGFYGQILMMPYAYLTGLDKSLISKNKARSMEEYLKLHEDLQDVFAEKMKQLFP